MSLTISDKHKFVFVHIPKCAGQYIKSYLQPLDDRNGYFHNIKKSFWGAGNVDFGHLPLSVLHKHFQADYAKVLSYYSFCTVRDPFLRFPSAFSQRIRTHKNKELIDLQKKEIFRELDEVLALLDKHRNVDAFPPEISHFQPQADYVFNNGLKVVKHVYSVNNIAMLFDNLMAACDVTFINPNTEIKKNTSFVFRNQTVEFFYNRIWPFRGTFKLFPENIKAFFTNVLFSSPQQRHKNIFFSDHMNDFILSFYKKDVDLFNMIEKNRKTNTNNSL